MKYTHSNSSSCTGWQRYHLGIKVNKMSEDFSFHLFSIGMNLYGTIQNLPFGEN